MKNLSMFRSFALVSLVALLVGTGCIDGFLDIPPPPWEQQDDDDAVQDDDDAEDLAVTFTGTVVATARDTGEVMSDWAYLICAGKTVLYITTDPEDLSDPAAKFTMDTPGEWELVVQRGTGPYWLVALSDDGNRIIGVEDVRREYPFNPVSADEDQSGLEVVMDLPCNADGSDGGGPGGWGGNGGGGGFGGGGAGGGGGEDPSNVTVFSGQVILNDLVNSDIMVTANSEDGSVGPIEWRFLEGAGAWSLIVSNNRSMTHLLAYHDTDGNGLFEASDAIGEPASNPFLLGIGDVPGVNIEIPSGAGSIPSPPVYVGVQGTVTMSNFPGGSIRVFASAGSPMGTTFSNATLSTPGSFALAAPIDAGGVMVWAVVDEDNDGSFDLSVDPFDSYGPFAVPANGVGGIPLELSNTVPNSIGGTVSYSGGGIVPEDILFIALFDNQGNFGDPTYVARYVDPDFPVDFVVPDVADGTWYVSALLDIGGDSVETGPGLDDITAVYGSGVNVTGGEAQGGINFAL
jgi:hypothetical protein